VIEYEDLGEVNKPFFQAYGEQFKNVLEGGAFILGTQVAAFEKEFATYCGAKHCAGVGSGLDALMIALRSFDFRNGGEVIVPSNTYIATILAIVNCGLKPVLVEPDIHTYNIGPSLVELAVTANTVAVIAVHLYGKCCNMEEVTRVCNKHHLKLIEDCAQSHGAAFRGKKCGTFGNFGAFSFYPTKNLGALGDAGALITNDDEHDRRSRAYRNYGSEKKYYNEFVGVNSRLDEIQAAFLRLKLATLDSINQHKRNLAALYSEGLKSDFVKPVIDSDYLDVYHIYSIRHPRRDALKEYLFKNDVKTEIHYPVPPHRQKAMTGILEGPFPISEEIHNTVLSLPISFMHTETDITRIIDLMNRF